MKKANDHVLEAEKGKVIAEAENRVLKERMWEADKKLGATDDKLRGAELHKRLLEKEVQSYKERAADLQAEVERGRRQREEEVTSLEQQLGDARRQQQSLEEEFKALQKEMEEKQER